MESQITTYLYTLNQILQLKLSHLKMDSRIDLSLRAVKMQLE